MEMLHIKQNSQIGLIFVDGSVRQLEQTVLSKVSEFLELKLLFLLAVSPRMSKKLNEALAQSCPA